MKRAFSALALATLPQIAQAQDGPGGFQVVATESSTSGSVRMPRAPFVEGTAPPTASGTVIMRALQRSGSAMTSQQIVEPVKATYSENGFETVFTCADAACGGFDFRFQLDLLPEPAMHVDLGNYRYVLMENDEGDAVSLVSSRSASTAYLQITDVSTAGGDAPEPVETVTISENFATPAASLTLTGTLTAEGSVTLGDLEFETGAATLGSDDYPSLGILAGWLNENPAARIALVGHTDSVGSLDANQSLSRRRATSVRERLIENYGVDGAQIEALGAGYLSPIASNLTEEGRAANRRVEAVLLSLPD